MCQRELKNSVLSTRFARPATRSLVLAASPLAEERERADHAEAAAGVPENKVPLAYGYQKLNLLSREVENKINLNIILISPYSSVR